MKNATTAKGGAMPKSPSFDALSFVARNHPTRGEGFNYWAVEPTGSYVTDCDKGRVLAAEYLAFLGSHPTNGNAALLQMIVGSMIDRAKAGGSDFRGIEVGFLQGVNEYALASARLLVRIAA